jgi:hypothetical protein
MVLVPDIVECEMDRCDGHVIVSWGTQNCSIRDSFMLFQALTFNSIVMYLAFSIMFVDVERSHRRFDLIRRYVGVRIYICHTLKHSS